MVHHENRWEGSILMYYHPLQPYPGSIYCLPFIPVNQPVDNYHRIQPQTGYPEIRRQYPKVDPTLFHQSAETFKQLMKDGNVLLNKLSESREFAGNVMDAAQRGDQNKVKQLIHSAGIKERVEVRYTPDGITFDMYSDKGQCCKLAMSLRWK